jgi:hypothetical protein
MVIPIDLAEIPPGCTQERPMVAAAELSFPDLIDDQPDTFQVQTDAYMDAGVPTAIHVSVLPEANGAPR